jgi:hypothetical protein
MRAMVMSLSILTAVAGASAQRMAMPVDVSKLIVGAPAMVTELDLGKLKGELRQVGWSADDTQLYVQTADGEPQSPKLRHYIVPIAGGAPKPLDAQPDWAAAYWSFKSDRTAPGVPALVIDVERKSEKTKIGTGSGRPGATGAGGLGDIAVDLEKTTEGQHQDVVRLTLLGETVGEFVNERPIPGLMFGWGPRGTGVVAYTSREGQLKLLDQEARVRTVQGAKDALLPAWSNDGTRLAWVQKSGRKKYVLMVAGVSKS